MKQTRGWCLGLLLCASVGMVNAADNWPVFRGNGQDGVEAQTNAFANGYGLDIAYTKETGSGYSAISVNKGLAVHMYSDGTHDRVTAFDANSGQQIWSYQIGEHYKGHDGSHDGTISTPALDDQAVYGLSAHGALFALDLKTGNQRWRKDMTEDLKGIAPGYGYASSPLLVGDVLIIQTGGKGTSITGLNKKTGEVLWAHGEDEVSYQSPIFTRFLGKDQVIGLTAKHLFGLNPADGRILWEHAHGGDGGIADPVMVGDSNIFFPIGRAGAKMFQASRDGDGYVFSEAWSTNEIRSNNITVHHDGYLYGYSGRFLTCLDAKTGERVWKSRPPGDGFLILVDGHLVIISKKGTLHVAEASPKGYQEKASTQVFDSLTWAHPTFANGKIFVRNLKAFAAIDVGSNKTTKIVRQENKKGREPGSAFASWVNKVETASDKTAMVDAFMKKQTSFPVIEKGYAHVIYRGEAKDIAISGDMLENGEDQPLHHIKGTDLAYYSFSLDNNAHISYQLSIDFESAGADPLNPYKANGFPGEVFSRLAMPEFKGSFPMKAAKSGKVEELEFESTVTNTKRKAWVYLPPGYNTNGKRYPTAYFSYGKFAYESGQVHLALDNAIGNSVAPMIAVFIDLHPEQNFGELRGDNKPKYMKMVAEELVPQIDKRFHTDTQATARTSVGYSSAGYIALEIGMLYPKVFNKIACFSVNFDASRQEHLAKLLAGDVNTSTQIVVDWGRFDLRNKGNELDFPRDNRKLFKMLEEKGFNIAGGEQPHGYGWANWATRTVPVFSILYPPRS